MDFETTILRCRAALDDFSRGNPEPVKTLFSHGDDVTLANPFGPPVRGWKRVEEALDYASARFRDGTVTKFETIAEYRSEELATILEIEEWKSKVSRRLIPVSRRRPSALRRFLVARRSLASKST